MTLRQLYNLTEEPRASLWVYDDDGETVLNDEQMTSRQYAMRRVQSIVPGHFFISVYLEPIKSR